MAKAQHRTPEHRRARINLGKVIAAGYGWCVQGEPGTDSSGTCLYETRHIPPLAKWDVAHNDAGTRIIGAAHQRCNRKDGSERGKLVRSRRAPLKPSRWVLRVVRTCTTCRLEFSTWSPDQFACGLETCQPPALCKVYFPSCAHCDAPFTARTRGKRYCSRRCNDAHHNTSRVVAYRDGQRRACELCAEVEVIAPRRQCDACMAKVKLERKRRERKTEGHRRRERARVRRRRTHTHAAVA